MGSSTGAEVGAISGLMESYYYVLVTRSCLGNQDHYNSRSQVLGARSQIMGAMMSLIYYCNEKATIGNSKGATVALLLSKFN